MPGSLPRRQRLIFEGPGQGSMLFERQIAYRRIAITGCSKGMKARRYPARHALIRLQ